MEKKKSINLLANQVLDSFQSSLIYFDEKGEIIDCNNAAKEHMLRWHETLPKNIKELHLFTESLRTSILSGNEHHSEIITYNPNIQKLSQNILPNKITDIETVLVDYAPIKEDGEFVCHAVKFNDVSRFHHNAMKNQVSAEKLKVLSSVLEIVHVNYMPETDTLDIYGGRDQYNFTNAPLELITDSICHPDDKRKAGNFIDKAKKDTSHTHRVNLRMKVKVLDEYHHFLFILIPQNTVEGDFLYYAGFCIDINDQMTMLKTQKEKLSSKIETLQKETEKSKSEEKKMGDMLSVMGHDLRTPLGTIIGFSELIAYSDDPDEKEEYLQYIRLSTDQMTMLINDILEATRIDSGRITFNKTTFDVTELLQDVHKQLLLHYKMLPIELLLEEPNTKIEITTDRLRLVEILNNYITNAAKYTHEGNVTLSCEITHGGICIHVVDTGVGIAPENCEKVFDRDAQHYSERQRTRTLHLSQDSRSSRR